MVLGLGSPRSLEERIALNVFPVSFLSRKRWLTLDWNVLGAKGASPRPTSLTSDILTSLS